MTQFKILKGHLDFVPDAELKKETNIHSLQWAFKKGARKQAINQGDTLIIFNDKARKNELMRLVMNGDNYYLSLPRRDAKTRPEWDKNYSAIQTTYLQDPDSNDSWSYVKVAGIAGKFSCMPKISRETYGNCQMEDVKTLITYFRQKKPAILIPAKKP